MEFVHERVSRRLRIWIGAAALLLAAVAAPPAGATVITVTTTVDQVGGAPGCSLRQAVSAADLDEAQGGCPKGSGSDTIRLPGGSHLLTIAGAGETLNASGDLNIENAGAITIEPAGSGPVAIDANDLDRAVRNGGGGALTLRDLTIRRGLLKAMVDGAGLLNESGKLTLEGVTITGGRSQAGKGGAVANYDQLTIVNSTLSGNNATESGGALWAAGATTSTIRSTTISGNAADAFGVNVGDGGGIAGAPTATINATNTIIAGNFDNSPASTVAPDCSTGPGFFPRYTLIGNPTPVHCLVGFDPGTNRSGDPKLGPLTDNGGATPTRLPLPDSPAVDAAGAAAPDQCPPLDQRGVARPKGAACDIGSVEWDPAGLDAPPAGSPRLFLTKPRPRRAQAEAGAKVRFRLRVRNTGSAPALRVRVCLALGKRARSVMRPVGKRCRGLGRIDPGSRRAVRLAVRVRPTAAGRAKVGFRALALGVKQRRRSAALQIR